jgi:hypothetical protein
VNKGKVLITGLKMALKEADHPAVMKLLENNKIILAQADEELVKKSTY